MLGDSFKNFDYLLSNIIKNSSVKTYFYFDPPFYIREGMENIYFKTVELIKKIDKDICEMIIIEHIKGDKSFDKIENFKILKSKNFGNTTLTYLIIE